MMITKHSNLIVYSAIVHVENFKTVVYPETIQFVCCDMSILFGTQPTHTQLADDRSIQHRTQD